MSTVSICFSWEYDDAYDPIVVDQAFVAKIQREELCRIEAQKEAWYDDECFEEARQG